MARVLALVPARSGSRRIPAKNVRRLGGHPLLAYTISAARASGVFARVIVSTDSEEYADVARHYGAEVPFLRPAELSGDESLDIEWLEHLLRALRAQGEGAEAFCLLRPTSPFRQAATIRRAWDAFAGETGVDSLRAVQKVSEHPGKMWVVRGERMSPLLPLGAADRPWHSSPYGTLPPVHVQNASLEIAWSRVVLEDRTIAGAVVMPFLTEGHEGLDLNSPVDWLLAELLIARGETSLPDVDRPAWRERGA